MARIDPKCRCDNEQRLVSVLGEHNWHPEFGEFLDEMQSRRFRQVLGHQHEITERLDPELRFQKVIEELLL